MHFLVLEGEPSAGPAEPRLDLIEDQQDLVGVAEAPQFREPTDRRENYASLTLDRLDQHRDGRRRNRPFDRGRVAETNSAKARRKRAEAVLILRLGREPDDGRGSTVKIAVRDDDLRPISCHALDAITPAARGFDG